jgi:hypothetical protein
MADKKQIESILRVNGLGTSAPDEEIRSVLISARFDDDEVNAALVVLRENTKTNETRVDGLHKVFRTDEGLQPKEVSRLLGINIAVRDPIERDNKKRHLSYLELFLLSLVSLLLATVFILVYMYSHDIGIFHPASVLKINVAKA